MKHLTIESFVNSLTEEELWKIIEVYEKYGARSYEAQFLMDNALKNYPTFCYRDAFTEFVLFAYRHFAMKYKEIMK